MRRSSSSEPTTLTLTTQGAFPIVNEPWCHTLDPLVHTNLPPIINAFCGASPDPEFVNAGDSEGLLYSCTAAPLR